MSSKRTFDEICDESSLSQHSNRSNQRSNQNKRQQAKLNFEVKVFPFQRSTAPTREHFYNYLSSKADILIVSCSKLGADSPMHAEPFYTFKIFIKLLEAATENSVKNQLEILMDEIGLRTSPSPTEYQEIIITSIANARSTISRVTISDPDLLCLPNTDKTHFHKNYLIRNYVRQNTDLRLSVSNPFVQEMSNRAHIKQIVEHQAEAKRERMPEPYIGRINLREWFGDQRDDFIVNYWNRYCDNGWYDRMPAAVILGPTRSGKSTFIRELLCAGLTYNFNTFMPDSWGSEKHSRFTWSGFDNEVHKIVITEETLNFDEGRKKRGRTVDQDRMKEILNCQGFTTQGICSFLNFLFLQSLI